jgi:hypothetical protein
MSDGWKTHPPVLGIDTNSYGFHVVSSVPIFMPGMHLGDEKRTFGWTLSAEKRSDDRRYAAFAAARSFFHTLPRASSVFIEEPLILSGNIVTTRMLVMMGGILEAAFLQARPDATFHWVDVSTWRRRVLGVGGGKKDHMKDLARRKVQDLWYAAGVRENDPIRQVYERQDDLHDAHCICEYGKYALLDGVVTLK